MNKKLLEYVKKKFVNVATDLIENPQGLKFRLETAKEKLNKESVKDALGKSVEDLKALLRMVMAWITRRYRDVSKQTIIYSVVAIIYFVTPTDFIPDFLLGLGFIDDIAVISWVISLIQNDLEKFKEWERSKKEEI